MSLEISHLVIPAGLEGGYQAIKAAISAIENNIKPKIKVLGEPRLGARGLYPNIGIKGKKESMPDLKPMMHLISYCDGSKSLLEIAELINQPIATCKRIIDLLVEKNLVEVEENILS